MKIKNIIIEEYMNVFGEESDLEINEGIGKLRNRTMIDIRYNDNIACYVLTKDENKLVSTSIPLIFDNKDIFNKIVGVNESVAKKIGCSKIIMEALHDNDKKWLQDLRYIFEKGKYLGVKDF